MKLRHAAALALVGWYLMLPPLDHGVPIVKAPYSEWDNWQGFDTADACQAKKSFFQNEALEPAQKIGETATQLAMDCRFFDALCIATDDPRLKAN